MKWLKFKSEMETEMSENTSVKKFFEILQPIKSNSEPKDEFSKALEEMFKSKGFNQWVTHMDFRALGKKAKRKYEIFCGGFLYYHDVEFKKYPEGKGFSLDDQKNPIWKVYEKAKEEKFEHKIYFEWLPKGNSKKTSVRIYINDTPDEYNVDPPPPPKPPPPEA